MKKGLAVLAIALFGFFAVCKTTLAAPVVIADGKKVSMTFTLSADGQVIDRTYETKPFEFVQGTEMLLPNLQKNLMGLKSGDAKEITLKAEEAFGIPNPQAVLDMPREKFPADQEIKAGMMFNAQGPNGPLHGRVLEVGEKTVKLDFNHPLAGKTVQFNVQIVSVA